MPMSTACSEVELVWETHQARFLAQLASLGRLIRFDKRGTGMSDRVSTRKPLMPCARQCKHLTRASATT
jgi:hypothetical protein